MRYTNDPSVLPDKDTTGPERPTQRVQNVMFVNLCSFSCHLAFISHNALFVVATRSISPGQELFVDYDSKYSFRWFL